MIVDGHTVGPAPAGAAPTRSDVRPDRAAWLREMEKQEMTAWLAHPVAVPAAAAPVVYARIDPPAMPADAPVAGDDAAAAPRAGRDGAAPAATDAAPSRGDARAGDPDAEAAGTGDRHGHDADTESGDVAAAVGAAADSSSPAVPAQLAAAVMAVLAQGQGAQGGAEPSLQAAVPAVAGVTRAAVAAPQPTATALARPPGIQPTATAPRPLQTDVRRAPAETHEEAGGLRGRPAARPEQAAGPGQALPPLRIHAMRTAAGVRVWIGADEVAGLGGQQLLLAAMDIRRLLRDQGVALASLTYNGESVFDADDPPEASGTPRERDASAPRTTATSGIAPRNKT
jgi:hypothetical protein